MTGMNNLTRKILEDAQEKQRQMIDSGKRELTEQLATQEASLAEQTAQQIAILQQKNQQMIERKQVAEQGKIHHEILFARQEKIDEVIQTAFNQLTELSPEAFRGYVIRSIKESGLTGPVEFLLGSKSVAYNTSQEVQVWVEAVAPEVELIVKDEIVPNCHGFVLKQAYIEIDCLFETLFHATQEEWSAQLSHVLFTQE